MYRMDLYKIILLMLLGLAVWTTASILIKIERKVWMGMNICLFMVALYGVFFYTVIGRTPSDTRQVAFFAPLTDDFWREMLMNVFLYYPVGLFLPNVLNSYRNAIFSAFALSFGIELWQLFACTGLAQGTDVICNTLGVVIGGLNYLIVKSAAWKD